MNSDSIIGPFFFEDSGGAPITANGENYRKMLKDYVLPQIELHIDQPLERTWFQQDGATSHTAAQTIQLLKESFGTRVVSLKSSNPWSVNSPDPIPLDSFLWGYLKDRVYVNEPKDMDKRKCNMRKEIENLHQGRALLCKDVHDIVPQAEWVQKRHCGQVDDLT